MRRSTDDKPGTYGCNLCGGSGSSSGPSDASYEWRESDIGRGASSYKSRRSATFEQLEKHKKLFLQGLLTSIAAYEKQVRHFGSCSVPKCKFHSTNSNLQEGFVQPNKRHTAKNNTTLVSNHSLATNNKFQILENNDKTNETHDNTVIIHKIPPIIIRQNDNVKEQLKTMHYNINDDSIKINLSGELIKVYPNSDDNHRNITTMLKAHKYDYFVITPKSKRPIKAVLKGLPKSTTTDKIKEELSEKASL
ncbi:RNA-directed DNA polymerase from mobile element jockey [Caerostris extrusa]|uniref:RNA-directed DNA polymerase from mobile element jockey n=1 Tax=Caerostris extrusa TaxID=172846 RepID=A0AAV4VMP4_CAEEX|nr:RNA-directed DNA polymerase from mobile element jockey [Caerostris extrusa]